jgi:hypothetical protein
MFKVGDIVKYKYVGYYIRYGYIIDLDEQVEQEIKVQWFDGETLWYLPSTLMKMD